MAATTNSMFNSKHFRLTRTRRLYYGNCFVELDEDDYQDARYYMSMDDLANLWRLYRDN